MGQALQIVFSDIYSIESSQNPNEYILTKHATYAVVAMAKLSGFDITTIEDVNTFLQKFLPNHRVPLITYRNAKNELQDKPEDKGQTQSIDWSRVKNIKYITINTVDNINEFSLFTTLTYHENNRGLNSGLNRNSTANFNQLSKLIKPHEKELQLRTVTNPKLSKIINQYKICFNNSLPTLQEAIKTYIDSSYNKDKSFISAINIVKQELDNCKNIADVSNEQWIQIALIFSDFGINTEHNGLDIAINMMRVQGYSVEISENNDLTIYKFTKKEFYSPNILVDKQGNIFLNNSNNFDTEIFKLLEAPDQLKNNQACISPSQQQLIAAMGREVLMTPINHPTNPIYPIEKKQLIQSVESWIGLVNTDPRYNDKYDLINEIAKRLEPLVINMLALYVFQGLDKSR